MQSLVRDVQRSYAAARLSLVEAFYGNESNGDNIAHVHAAAEYSRHAMRVAAMPPVRTPLFGWLRIRTTYSAQSEDAEGPSSQAPAFGNAETPVASSRISEGNARPLPPPATMWGPHVPRRFFAPPGATRPPIIWPRKVSAVSSFGSQQLGDDVFTWLARCEGRQRRLIRRW